MTARLHRTNSRLFASLGMMLLALVVFVPGATLMTAAAHAQSSSSSTPSSGAAPDLGNTVQGQSSGTIESALRTAMNYLGNVICPIISIVFFVITVLNWRNGKGVAGPLITACLLLAISGVVRYAESLVS